MSVKYTHPELNNTVNSPSGYYVPQKEIRLKYNGKEVLYVTGHAAIEASCCGVADWNYVLVPGYIVSWQKEKNDAGLLVSEVEPISDESAKSDIRKIIQEAEDISPVEFW